MEQSITFVDVETPNYQNNSISSIGVIMLMVMVL